MPCMIAKCASDIVISLLATGIQRSVSLLFHKISRLKKVDKTIRGLVSTNPVVGTAVAEFETVIGTYRGELTEGLDRFIRELERSGLIEALIENAMLKRRSAAVRNQFITLHDSHIPNSEDNG